MNRAERLVPNVALITFVTFILQTGSLVTGHHDFMFLLQGMLGLDFLHLMFICLIFWKCINLNFCYRKHPKSLSKRCITAFTHYVILVFHALFIKNGKTTTKRAAGGNILLYFNNLAMCSFVLVNICDWCWCPDCWKCHFRVPRFQNIMGEKVLLSCHSRLLHKTSRLPKN